MPTSYCYLFEAKGIQKYIFDTGRLADLIGASSLVSDLCNSDAQDPSVGDDLLQEILRAVEFDEPAFSRRAGAAFCIHSEDRDQLVRLRALWRLALSVSAPGLTFTDTEPVPGETPIGAMTLAYKKQSGVRENTAAFLLPIGGPMTEFNPRSGRFSVAREKVRDDATLLLDQVTEVQRARAEQLARSTEVDPLAAKFLPEGAEAEKYLFPRHFESADATRDNPAFPFGVGSGETPRDNRIAVIHADISGLGRIFRDAQNTVKTPGELKALAMAIERAIEQAARAACAEEILDFAAKDGDRGFARLFGPKGQNNPPRDKEVVPARPVLLGGDDITIVTRADLAIRFTRTLLKEIEHRTKDLETGRLTACAGVAVVSSGHPFLAAHNMAEGMCSVAKAKAKAGRKSDFPSYLSFSVITSSIDEDFREDYRAREKQTVHGDDMNVDAYLVSDPVGQTIETGERLDRLLDLAEVLDRTEGYGKLLEVLGLCQENAAGACETWSRFWEVLDPNDRSDLVKALHACLGLEKNEDAPALGLAAQVLNDALELVDIGAIVNAGAEQ